MAAQGQDDRICGKTIRWSFSEGPVQGKSFEHRFRDDGTVVWRELGGAAPAQGDQETGVPYTAQRLSDEAQRSVARELVLDAVADELELEVPDAEVEELVREQAEAVGDDSQQMLDALRESGRFEALRDDLRLRKALDRVAAEVKRIPLAQAEAREAIWTPDKEKPPTETKLWTPGEGAAST